MSRDALKTPHAQQPEHAQVNTKQTFQLHLHHLCTLALSLVLF